MNKIQNMNLTFKYEYQKIKYYHRFVCISKYTNCVNQNTQFQNKMYIKSIEYKKYNYFYQ